MRLPYKICLIGVGIGVAIVAASRMAFSVLSKKNCKECEKSQGGTCKIEKESCPNNNNPTLKVLEKIGYPEKTLDSFAVRLTDKLERAFNLDFETDDFILEETPSKEEY